MKYKLKDFVTKEDLKKVGFRQPFKNINTFVRYDEPTNIVVFFNSNIYANRVIMSDDPHKYMKRRYIADLIEKGYVEVVE